MFGLGYAFQTDIFIKSLGAGFFLGFIYSVFQCMRKAGSRGKAVVFVQDLCFFVISALVTFIFSFEVNFGYVRGYLLAGEIMGFCIFYLLPSKVTVLLTEKITWPFRNLIGIIRRKMKQKHPKKTKKNS